MGFDDSMKFVVRIHARANQKTKIMTNEPLIGGGLFLLTLLLFIIPLAIATFVFWICMLISAIQNKGLGEGEKVSWVVVIALLHLLGAILYFFIGRPKRNQPLHP